MSVSSVLSVPIFESRRVVFVKNERKEGINAVGEWGKTSLSKIPLPLPQASGFSPAFLQPLSLWKTSSAAMTPLVSSDDTSLAPGAAVICPLLTSRSLPLANLIMRIAMHPAWWVSGARDLSPAHQRQPGIDPWPLAASVVVKCVKVNQVSKLHLHRPSLTCHNWRRDLSLDNNYRCPPSSRRWLLGA